MAAGVGGKRRAIEHDLVLSAHQMGVEQRHAHVSCTFGHARLALASLVQVERRCIEHAQHLCPGSHRGRGRLVEPRVLADQHAEPFAAGIEHHRRQARLAATDKVAPLVEHLVVGQFTLAVGGLHMTRRQHRCRVETHRRSQRARARRHHGGAARRVAQQHRQTGERCQLAGQRAELPFTGLHEGRTQQQVFRRIARQSQLRCDHQRCAAGVGLARGVGNLPCIAGQVADRRVDLRQRDADHGHVERWQVGG